MLAKLIKDKTIRIRKFYIHKQDKLQILLDKQDFPINWSVKLHLSVFGSWRFINGKRIEMEGSNLGVPTWTGS